MKSTIFISETRWSEWLESMRKDVECTLRTLKGRWRVLKSGTRLNGVDVADGIRVTCCALHNMLLEEDRVAVDWIGVYGEFDYEPSSDTIPFALQRLNNLSLRRAYDTSGMGCSDTTDDDADVLQPVPVANDHMIIDVSANGINNMHQLTCDSFRKKLIENFDVLFKKNKIK